MEFTFGGLSSWYGVSADYGGFLFDWPAVFPRRGCLTIRVGLQAGSFLYLGLF